MKKSLVFGILLSICMTIPTMADTSNSGIVIEPISSLQEQLEEMTEEQKVIAIEKYYSVEDEKIVETRASWYQLGDFICLNSLYKIIVWQHVVMRQCGG